MSNTERTPAQRKEAGYSAQIRRWIDDQPLAQILAHGGINVDELNQVVPTESMEGRAMRNYLARVDGRWLEWTGKVWTEVSGDRAIKLISSEMSRMHRWLCSQDNVTADAAKLYATLLSSRKSKAILHFIGGELLVDSDKFDAHPDLLNAQNGVVDLRTGELLPHRASLRLTKITSVPYDPYAESVDWETALKAIPDDVIQWLQVRYGQAITGHRTDDDRVLVQDGPGSNGKTTVTSASKAALGSYGTSVSHKVLLAKPGEHSTESMSLKGARFALLEELPEGGRVNDHQLKTLAGSETMNARRMRMDDETFRVTHSLIINTNHMPVVQNADHSTWRRFARVRFPYKFVGPDEPLRADHYRKGDPTIRERILGNEFRQLQAVLAWLVEGARAWYDLNQDLSAWPWPDSVKADTAAWQAESDPILNWANDRLIIDPNSCVLSTELYEDFAEFLRSTGRHVWNDQTFTSRFEIHEIVMSSGIERARVTAPTNLSRRIATQLAMPITGKVRVWRGVRFA